MAAADIQRHKAKKMLKHDKSEFIAVLTIFVQFIFPLEQCVPAKILIHIQSEKMNVRKSFFQVPPP